MTRAAGGLCDRGVHPAEGHIVNRCVCTKSALLIANTGDDEEQSLKELVPVGDPELKTNPGLWVEIAAEGLPIAEQHKHWWVKALEGLLEVRSFALVRFAEYLLRTREAVADGQPILFALGVALPALRVPRDTAFFRTLNDKTAGYTSKWKALYAQAIRKRGCYLVKQTPSQVFLLELEVELAAGSAETYTKQLVWKFDPNAIATEFPGDWSRLAEHPLVHCRVNREPISGKGRFQSLDLRNVRTLNPAYGQDRGSFVPIHRKEKDISLLWPANLAKAQEQGLVSEKTASHLLSLFQAFQQNYRAAIVGFLEEGLASGHLLKQAEDFSTLLDAICKDAKGDRNRDQLLRPLLEIGTVAVDGGRVTAIVTPWHPLRLAAIANKTNQVASLLRYLLTADEVFFGDPPLFFKELEQELSHPYYPEIALGWHDTKPELLSLTDHHLDYSLHETPVINNDGFDDTYESPAETSALIMDLTKRFLALWDGVENRRLLPARQLDFNDPTTGSIFKEIHYLGNWIVNFDELLDRRQLLNQGVKVIRYKQGVTQGRNILVSSTAPLGLLRSMVLGRVRDLNLELPDADCDKLTKRFIADANEISGDIVLRAAKRGRNASELMGVVLSRYLIRHELGTARRFGWYFLDDYAEWLGQREEQIADVLALSPEQTPGGKLQLAVIVSESKYIDAASVAAKRKESQKQLRDTLCRINDAIFGDPKRLDRDLWLSRFSDLIMNGIQFPANSPIDLAAWRRAVRDGECGIFMRGYSHIFVSGPSDAPDCSDFGAVAEAEHSYQEVFSRARLRELVLSYWKDSDPTPIRKANAGEDIWQGPIYRKPSGPVQILQPRKPRDDSHDQGGDTSGGPTHEPKPIRWGERPREPLNPQPGSPGVSPHHLVHSPNSPQELEAFATQKPKPNPPASPPAPATGVASVWACPKISQLLADYHGGTQDSAADAEWLNQVQSLCKGALQQFQLQSKLLGSALTPNAALLKFQGSAHLTVEQVLKRRSEFLTTHKLNVISVRAEPGVVAITIARPNRRILHLPEVWKTWNPNCSPGNHDLLIAVKEEDSSPLFLSPQLNAPHTLIAGSTGSGKSVLMQNIILGIACTNTTEQARIVLIDPKLGVDYFAFEGLPHLQGGVIDAQDKAIVTLNELVGEMNRRYAVLKANKVSNIFELNKTPNPTERLPFLWVIHDEFAEWMMTAEYADAVSDIVGRLGVKARAAGISLVFAAQRPDANVMPMQLRANLGNRLVLRVDGEGTSEIALGEKGAERLLGKGHSAAKLEGAPDIIYGQVPFVDSGFLSQAVTLLKEGEHTPHSGASCSP